MSETAGDLRLERLLADALRPIEPPDDLASRVQTTLASIAEQAAAELSSLGRRALRGRARSAARPAQLGPPGGRGGGRRRRGGRAADRWSPSAPATLRASQHRRAAAAGGSLGGPARRRRDLRRRRSGGEPGQAEDQVQEVVLVVERDQPEDHAVAVDEAPAPAARRRVRSRGSQHADGLPPRPRRGPRARYERRCASR